MYVPFPADADAGDDAGAGASNRTIGAPAVGKKRSFVDSSAYIHQWRW
mgnify:CR=1 FL=1